MGKGYDIQLTSETAVTTVINHLGVGIPLALTLRELTINGIEACLRNTEEPDIGVYVVKDHIHQYTKDRYQE